jgi:hypothetical protein
VQYACAPARNADCRGSTDCRELGACEVVQTGCGHHP